MPRKNKKLAGSGAEKSTGAVVMNIPVSHPGKPLWPDTGPLSSHNNGRPVTKLELARYYESIGAWMLPHIKGRPCSILRAPDGVAGQRFFQRHAMPGQSSLFREVRVSGDRKPYLEMDSVAALVAVA
jgi:bifunctional non-homologous end joining protein LigD